MDKRYTIEALLRGIDYRIVGPKELCVYDLCIDSRNAKAGSLFIAIEGYATDGHLYIDDAIDQGAVAVLCSKLPKFQKKGICYIQVDNTKYCAGIVAHTFFERPSSKLCLVGVTGTNGKTTTAYMLYQLWAMLGYRCGLLSTVEYSTGIKVYTSYRTTPDPIQLNSYLYQMVEAGCTHAVMEVSSHAIDQYRISGLEFDGAIFTNLSHDHLDYHKTMANYRDVKKSWFDGLPERTIALANLDDRHGAYMLQNTKAAKRYFALNAPADYRAVILSNAMDGLQLLISGQPVYLQLRAKYNAYNVLAVYAMAKELGEKTSDLLNTLSLLKPVKGRFETISVKGKKIWGIIDYAHTPDALKNILENIKKMKPKNTNLITVTGCGGDRDRTKRPQMAQIAFALSDLLILTSDNPRTEDPKQIIRDMLEGLEPEEQKKVLCILDRQEAIQKAVDKAKSGDVILIAGKGHEMYQEINGKKHPFDEAEIFKSALKNKN